MASAQGASSKTRKASAATHSPQKAQSASSSVTPLPTKSFPKQQGEQDLSCLQEPTVSEPPSYSPQLPLNSSRPNTRAHSTEFNTGVSSKTRKETETELPDPAAPEDEADQAVSGSPQGEDNTSVETIELIQTENIEGQAEEDVVTIESTSSDAAIYQISSSEPSTASEPSEKKSTASTAPAVTTEEAQTEPQPLLDKGLSTPPPTAPPGGDEPIAPPSTPVRVPAQIVVVNASPSKRVVFSTNEQESRLSTPSAIPAAGLKSILKSPVKSPFFQAEDTNAARRGSGGVSTGRSTSRDPTSATAMDSDPTEMEPFIAKAIESLESDDLQLRATTYTGLQTEFRTRSNAQNLDEVRITIRSFTVCLLRDMDPSNPPNL